jgi:hypothetical protein
MTKATFSAAFLGAAVLAASLAAAPAQAGSFIVQPGATTQIDVAERNNYTTIVVTNGSNVAGSLQIPAGGATVAVPANGKIELYDRYSSGPIGNAVMAVTNTGSVPLRVISQYSVRLPLP